MKAIEYSTKVVNSQFRKVLSEMQIDFSEVYLKDEVIEKQLYYKKEQLALLLIQNHVNNDVYNEAAGILDLVD